MALPPTIPTSFVPHTPSATRAAHRDFSGAFGVIAYMILVIALVLAGLVFFYDRILQSQLKQKDADLAQQEAAIDPATVESFVRLSNRLNAGQTLLQKHVAFSGFFTDLERLMPTSVRLSSLHVSLDPTGVAKIDGSGVAKSFNALSAASQAFASDGHIKDVIFSHMTINKDSSVSFGITATVDPSLLNFSPSAYQAAPPSSPDTQTP